MLTGNFHVFLNKSEPRGKLFPVNFTKQLAVNDTSFLPHINQWGVLHSFSINFFFDKMDLKLLFSCDDIHIHS